MKENENIPSFISNAKGLARNPLGIIALFISLIYGFACLVLGISGSNFDNFERLILIIFLVLFPILILITFFFLVTRHHQKLYAPSDFKDERIFLESIDIESQKSKIQDQIVETKSQIEIQSQPINRTEKLRNYLIVENLILRLIENDFNLPIRRHVKFQNHENTFDCILEGKDKFIAIEIKYYYILLETHAEVVALHLKRKLHSFQRISKEYFPELTRKFILYIVYDNDINNNITGLKSELIKLLEHENQMEIELRYYEYNSLLGKFGF